MDTIVGKHSLYYNKQAGKKAYNELDYIVRLAMYPPVYYNSVYGLEYQLIVWMNWSIWLEGIPEPLNPAPKCAAVN